MKNRWLVLSVGALAVSTAVALLSSHFEPQEAPAVPPAGPAAPAAPTPSPAAEAAPPPMRSEIVEVRPRDTVLAALTRHDVPSATAYAMVAAMREAGARMRGVRAGSQLELGRDGSSGLPVKLTYPLDAWVRYEAVAGDSGWTATRVETAPDIRIEVRHAEVRQSVWDAVDSGAVTPAALFDLVKIFESEFDFASEAQRGDRFRMLVEARYADGVLVDYGRIVAAQYASGDRVLTGVGFDDGGRFRYYDAEGRSLRKMFLRSPLEFTRISSGFTHRRPHPVLGGVRPHLAIDYAAPTGTPVWAVADGVVVFAGRKGGNGIQVRLRHRGGYETYYNHLSRIASGIRTGARVAQKQVIGRVGSTGLSTGPHLDYRVSQGGRFVNPLNEKFFPGEPIAKARQGGFLEHARSALERLDREAPFEL